MNSVWSLEIFSVQHLKAKLSHHLSLEIILYDLCRLMLMLATSQRLFSGPGGENKKSEVDFYEVYLIKCLL